MRPDRKHFSKKFSKDGIALWLSQEEEWRVDVLVFGNLDPGEHSTTT